MYGYAYWAKMCKEWDKTLTIFLGLTSLPVLCVLCVGEIFLNNKKINNFMLFWGFWTPPNKP
jgi:hypothetical protein